MLRSYSLTVDPHAPPPLPHPGALPRKPLFDRKFAGVLLLPIMVYAVGIAIGAATKFDSSGPLTALLWISGVLAVACSIGCGVIVGRRREAWLGLAAFVIVVAFYGVMGFLGCTAAVVLDIGR